MPESTIAVITPFHNTDKELFNSAVSSMETQILSKDRIEWIIVVHNSEDEYLEYVRKRTQELKYVTIYELNNDKRTASSPRNYALEHVNSTYITFLDSDDMLTPECLSTIVRGMDETQADLGKYRGERRQEDENIASFLDNRVRFSQTKSLISFRKDSPEISKLLTMANMMMSCQVIRTVFLNEHHIRFNEDIRFEEDVVFNLECLNNASLIAVFPQMIGYIYYMHHGSTMQETTLSDERLLRICHDISTQLELGLDYGFDMRYLFMGHMKMIAEEMNKREWDISVRKEVRECMLPFYQKIPLPDPNEKFLTASELKRISDENESIILAYDVIDDGADALRRILKNNRDTELGKEWQFDTIKTAEEYQRRVPVTNYDFYSPYIELTTRIGESDIFCTEKITGYALSSGTSGRRKRIPYIAEGIEENAGDLWKLLEGKGSTFLLMQSICSEERFADGTYLDSITGATLQFLGKDIRCESFRLDDGRGAVTSPRELIFTNEGIGAYRKKLIYALLDRKVENIVAPFTWYILDILLYMQHHYDVLIDDIRNGITLNGEAHPERADELASIFTEADFEKPFLTRIWPGLKHIVAGGSGDFLIYTEQLKRYTGDVVFYEGCYASSEGNFASYDIESGKFRIRNDSSFFEFREIYSDGSEGNVLPMREVKNGCKYELIITNASGFYRYALGDVIRAGRLENGELLFDVLYRRNDEIRLPDGMGVIMPDAIYDALTDLLAGMHLPVGDYSYALSDDGNCLELYLEQMGHGTCKLDSFDRNETAGMFDRLLRGRSSSYDSIRGKVFEECKLFYIEADTQAAYREICTMRSRLTPDQMKPVRYMDNPVKKNFFTKFLIE